jgi:hypothetical protein
LAGAYSGGAVSDEFTSTLELYPSFVAAAGSARPATPFLDGFNFLPVLQGAAKSQRKDFSGKTATAGRHVLASRNGSSLPTGGGLFDLANDLGETRDLSVDRPQVLKELRQR